MGSREFEKDKSPGGIKLFKAYVNGDKDGYIRGRESLMPVVMEANRIVEVLVEIIQDKPMSPKGLIVITFDKLRNDCLFGVNIYSLKAKLQAVLKEEKV